MEAFLAYSLPMLALVLLILVWRGFRRGLRGAPFVPLRQPLLTRLLAHLPPLTPQSVFVDLGSGDGRVLFAVEAATGAAGHGYEYSRYLHSLALLGRLWRRSSVTLHCQDLYTASLIEVDCVFCYLGTRETARLAPLLSSQLKSGAHVISVAFPLPLPWQPARTVPQQGSLPPIYIYQR